MQAPTLAPSPFGIHGSRIRKIVAAGFAMGVVLAGYGATGTVIGLRPTGGGVAAVLQYVLMAVGVLLVSLTGLVTVWFARQDEPRPLRRRAVLITGLVAPLLSTGVLVAADWWRAGADPAGLQAFYWVLLGLAVLGLQPFVGAVEPAARRRRLFVAEAATVFVAVCSALLATRGTLDPPVVEAALFVSGGAVCVFLVVGGPLYVLGNLLVCRPRYHQIR